MRELGVTRLMASCLNGACQHTALIEVWSYPAATEIPYFKAASFVPSAAAAATRSTCGQLERATDAVEPDGQAMALSALIKRARNSGRACRLVAD